MWKVKSYEELEKLVKEKKEECFIIEEMIKESEGTLGFPICDVVNSLDEITSESKKK